MNSAQKTDRMGLELVLQRPTAEEAEQIPITRDADGNAIYPELDADGDHVHFEMVRMPGDSLLWLTMRRGTSPELAAASLRKIANLIERHGMNLLNLAEGDEGSVSAGGELISGPLRLDYDQNGDLVLPSKLINSPSPDEEGAPDSPPSQRIQAETTRNTSGGSMR